MSETTMSPEMEEQKRLDDKTTPAKPSPLNVRGAPGNIVDKVQTLNAPDWFVAYVEFANRTHKEIKENFEGFRPTAEQELETLKTTVSEQAQIISEQSKKLDDAIERISQLEHYSRKPNLVFEGIPEVIWGNTDATPQNLIKEKMLIKIPVQLSVSHRLGPNKSNDRARPIIAKFMSLNQRDEVWAARFKIKKGDGIKVREHFPKETDKQGNLSSPTTRKQGGNLR